MNRRRLQKLMAYCLSSVEQVHVKSEVVCGTRINA